MSEWYYRLFGEEFGPIPLELLQREIAAGQLTDNNEVRCVSDAQWTRVAAFVAQGFKTAFPTLPIDLAPHRSDDGHTDLESEPVCDAPALSTIDQWFCRGSRVGRGPYSFDDLRSFARRGELEADDLVCLGEQGAWRTAGSIGRLMTEMPFPLAESSAPASSPSKSAAEDDFEISVPLRASSPAPAPAKPQPARPVSNGNTAASVGPRSAPAAAETDKTWYAVMGRVERGPMELEKLMELAAAGHLLPTDAIRHGRNSEWISARAVPGLLPSYSSPSPSPAPAARMTSRPSITPPVMYAQTGYAPQPAPLMPQAVMYVPVQLAPPHPPAFIPPPTYSTSTATAPIPAPARPQSTPPSPRAVIASPKTTTTSSSPPQPTPQAPHQRPTFEAKPVSPQPPKPAAPHTPPGGGRSVETPRPELPRHSEPPFRRPPRQFNGESKHKLRRGQFDEAPLFSRKNYFKLAMGIGVFVLLIVGWNLIPERIGKFAESYRKLAEIYQTLDKKWSEKPPMPAWTGSSQEVANQIKPIEKKINEIRSGHEVQSSLINACSALKRAAAADKADDVELRLKSARKFLEYSSKALGIPLEKGKDS